MGETIESLLRKVSDLEKIKSFTIKEGEIIYVYAPEKISDKFTKIEVCIDASVIINGKIINDYLPFQISNYQKEFFKDFDQTGTECKYRKGDKIAVMCDVGAYATMPDKKHDNRTYAIANVSLVRVKMIEKAAPLPSERSENDFFFNPDAAAEKASEIKDDLPF